MLIGACRIDVLDSLTSDPQRSHCAKRCSDTSNCHPSEPPSVKVPQAQYLLIKKTKKNPSAQMKYRPIK